MEEAFTPSPAALMLVLPILCRGGTGNIRQNRYSGCRGKYQWEFDVTQTQWPGDSHLELRKSPAPYRVRHHQKRFNISTYPQLVWATGYDERNGLCIYLPCPGILLATAS